MNHEIPKGLICDVLKKLIHVSRPELKRITDSPKSSFENNAGYT